MTYDVVVVGARVAGASTAMLLARAGARVLLLDRARPGTDTLSTHAFMRAGVLQLARWGLLDRVRAAGTPPIRAMTFRYPGSDPVTVEVRPSRGVEALLAPRRRVLDPILVDAAVEAGAELRYGCRVTGLSRDRTGRVDGVLTAHGRIGARFVVGADGIRSVVAAAAGAPVQRRGRHASAVRYTYLDAPDAAAEWLYGDGAAGGVIPTNDGRACVFVSSTPDRLGRMLAGADADRAFRAALEQVAPGHPLADARRTERFHGWGGLPGFLRGASGPGWALVGDAGFYKDPMSTHGMSDALRDAELVAGALLAALGGDGEALAGYGRQRDAFAGPLLEVSDEIATYGWTGAGVVPLVKRLSAAMSDEVELLEARSWHEEGAA